MKIHLIFFICYTFCQFCTSSAAQFPVILVPGDGGSQLEVKLNKTSVPHYICEKHTDSYSSIWLNIEELLPGVIDCFVDNMKLVYKQAARKTEYGEGVQFRIPGWGETWSVEWLDPSSHYISSLRYFNLMVEALVDIGYKRGVSIRGAPYDFRRAPNELGEFYKKFQALVEDTYRINNNTKVILVAHSMGNPVTLYFLNQMAQTWKDKYLQSFVTLAGVWGGAVKPLRLFSSGDDLGIAIVKAIKVRPEQRSMPSSAFLMPSDQFWNSSEVLVFTDQKNYTVADYKQFFQDIDFMDGWYMREDTVNLIKELTPPNLPVYCAHGIGLPTPAGLVFGPGEFPDTYPKQISGDGDGTVNIRSLHGCLRWRKQQKQPVEHYPVEGVEHMHMLSEPAIINYVKDIVTGKR